MKRKTLLFRWDTCNPSNKHMCSKIFLLSSRLRHQNNANVQDFSTVLPNNVSFKDSTNATSFRWTVTSKRNWFKKTSTLLKRNAFYAHVKWNVCFNVSQCVPTKIQHLWNEIRLLWKQFSNMLHLPIPKERRCFQRILHHLKNKKPHIFWTGFVLIN